MSSAIQQTPVQRAKVLLKIDEEISLFDLLEHLREYRNETHPDKFTDEAAKKVAESRFKEAQNIIPELEKAIEQDKLNRPAMEVAVLQPQFLTVRLRSDLEKAGEEIETLKDSLAMKAGELVKLEEQLKEKNENSLRTEIETLKNLYKPSTRKVTTLTLGVVLALSLGLMSQMEAVSTVLAKHSPFDGKYISGLLFFSMVALLLVGLRNLWEHRYISDKSEEVCSPQFAAAFLEHLSPPTFHLESKVEGFSELDVYTYIDGKPSFKKVLLTLLGFTIYRPKTIRHLTNLFLHNLLNKSLIKPNDAKLLQRYFAITSEVKDAYYWIRVGEKMERDTRKRRQQINKENSEDKEEEEEDGEDD